MEGTEMIAAFLFVAFTYTVMLAMNEKTEGDIKKSIFDLQDTR